jgi:hypothetical protein
VPYLTTVNRRVAAERVGCHGWQNPWDRKMNLLNEKRKLVF